MDLNILFENIGSIATSLERIADSLEQRGGNTISVSATTATVEDKPARKRRTKAEIEAEAQAAAAPAVTIPEAQFAAPVAAPAVAAPAPVAAAPAPAPVVAVPTPVVAVPTPVVAVPTPVAIVPAPVVAAPAAEALPAGVDPAYSTYAVEHQFTVLNQLLAPYFNTYGQVRDAVFGEAAKHGLGAPFSDQVDRALPGANYRAVSNEARFAIYVAGAKAIAGLASL